MAARTPATSKPLAPNGEFFRNRRRYSTPSGETAVGRLSPADADRIAMSPLSTLGIARVSSWKGGFGSAWLSAIAYAPNAKTQTSTTDAKKRFIASLDL